MYYVTVFAWEAYEHGADIHLQADPTKLALLTKEVKQRKEDSKVQAKNSILEKYGGEEHLEAPPKQLLLAQTVCKCPSFYIKASVIVGFNSFVYVFFILFKTDYFLKKEFFV